MKEGKVKIEEFFHKNQRSKSYNSNPLSLPNGKTSVVRDSTHFNNVRSISSNHMRKLIHPTRSDLISTLSVENVNKKMHSGNYTCAPSNAKKTSIMVHVVDGKYIFIFKVVQSQQDNSGIKENILKIQSFYILNK